MKNKIKKIVLPMALVVVAIVGAFANKPSYQESTILEKRIGYIRVAGQCVETSVVCSTIFNPQLCTSGGIILYDKNGNSCLIPLYRNPL